MGKRLSRNYAQTLGELEYSINLAIFKYLRANESIEDELFILGNGQVRVFADDDDETGGKAIYISSKQANYEYEGITKLKSIPISEQLSILEQIEDYLGLD